MLQFNNLELKIVILNLILLLHLSTIIKVKSSCENTCTLALASYYVSPGATLLEISSYFNNSTMLVDDILRYNNNTVRNQDILPRNTRLNIPFPCGCVNDTFLGHVFTYEFQRGDTYENVAKYNYTNLTSASWIQRFNGYNPNNVPEFGIVNVPINCSCGDRRVSREYGLFISYPLQEGENLTSISRGFNLSESLLQGFNPGVNFSSGSGLVFIPGKDRDGNYPPLVTSDSASSGLAAGAIAGICVAAVVLIVLAVGFYFKLRRSKQIEVESEKPGYQLARSNSISPHTESAGNSGRRIGNSVEFAYEELAKATDNFNSSYQIGSGGFGVVFFGELRGQKAAIKKMDMEASREFLAELKVLTRVHHLHLVRLLGYCVEGSLFLVYEYIDNGNLSEHLRGSVRDPLPWSTRVQIALDAAKGLEYIHEHTDPVYIHRDIKPANILISNSFQAKVADFGLTKLSEVQNSTLPTRLVGTFGYMPPEYAQFGEVTPKVDVYAFGVVLYELISAKAAVVRQQKAVSESKGLVALFEDALNLPDPNEICKLVDPRLGDDYPLDSVRQMAELAKACTYDNPELRPSMRSVVVSLMSLSSNTGNWDIDSFYKNSNVINQLSGR